MHALNRTAARTSPINNDTFSIADFDMCFTFLKRSLYLKRFWQEQQKTINKNRKTIKKIKTKAIKKLKNKQKQKNNINN
jgi:hypothetical protein